MHKSHACTSTSRLQCCRRFLILFHKIWLKFVLVTTNRWTSECYGMEASKDRTLKKDKTLIKIWIPSIDSKSFCRLTWFIDAPPHENWRTMCYFWTNPHFMTATLTVSFSMKQTTLFKKSIAESSSGTAIIRRSKLYAILKNQKNDNSEMNLIFI